MVQLIFFLLENFFLGGNQFWVDVLSSWEKFAAVHKPLTYGEVLKTTVWNNNQTKIGNKSINYKHWSLAGIVFTCDLLDDNGCFYHSLILGPSSVSRPTLLSMVRL